MFVVCTYGTEGSGRAPWETERGGSTTVRRVIDLCLYAYVHYNYIYIYIYIYIKERDR